MFGIKGKLGSTKQKMSKLFRFIGDLEKEGSEVSSSIPLSAILSCTHAVNLEVELKKAEALDHWKRWLDRPK